MVSSDLYSVLGQANSAEDEQRLASIFPPYSFKYAQFPEIKKNIHLLGQFQLNRTSRHK